MLIAIVTCLLIFIESHTQAEFFSSTYKMQTLLITQKNIIENLEIYSFIIKKKKLEDVIRYMTRCKTEQAKAATDASHYLGNPLNAYSLIYRLTAEFNAIEEILYNSTGFVKNDKLDYPKEQDLKGAVEGIRLIQSTYKLDISDLANGILIGNFSKSKNQYMEHGTALTASECYELGVTTKNVGYKYKIAWLIEAFNKYQPDCRSCQFTDTDIVDQISHGYYNLGDVKNTLYWIKKRIEKNPADPKIEKYKQFEKHLNHTFNKGICSTQKSRKTKLEETGSHDSKNVNGDYLCFGETSTSVNNKSLSCYYAIGPHPFLRLAPIKAEQLHLTPNITLFYDVIADEEIRLLQNMAKPYLDKAKIQYSKTKRSSKYDRIAQSAVPKLTDVVKNLDSRMTQLSGMNLTFSEPPSIVNYGIGGNFLPHYDFWPNTHVKKMGNRIATFIFYMSDIDQGGATVFLKLNLTVFPVKGAALFLINLLPNGDLDFSTLHAGCPVVRGSKWVLSQYVNLQGQEFSRPCPIQIRNQ